MTNTLAGSLWLILLFLAFWPQEFGAALHKTFNLFMLGWNSVQ